MVKCIHENTPINSVKADSGIRKIEGQYKSLSLFKTKEGEEILKVANEILVQKEYRENLLNELYSTHEWHNHAQHLQGTFLLAFLKK